MVVWDCATAAPHGGINMHPCASDISAAMEWFNSQHSSLAKQFSFRAEADCSKDAAFFSGHKFLGGPGTPGVLVISKSVLVNRVPAIPGGGTVFYVDQAGSPTYLEEETLKEEGGTQDIVGSIR